MTGLMTDDELRQAALAVLEQGLGRIETLRFLALVRREPFDYQSWRDEAFGSLNADELFQRMAEREERPAG